MFQKQITTVCENYPLKSFIVFAADILSFINSQEYMDIVANEAIYICLSVCILHTIK